MTPNPCEGFATSVRRESGVGRRFACGSLRESAKAGGIPPPKKEGSNVLGMTRDGHPDKPVRLKARPFLSPRRAFQTSGYIGLVLAVLLTMVLARLVQLPPWVMAAVTLVAMSSFLGLAMLTRIVVGEERLTFYHHAIAVMAVTGTLAWLLRQPVLPYLDVTVLGLGVFLACGRLGCLMVGCCHGVPHRRGVRYRTEHVRAGFTPHYVGVRLFPIQAVESLWVLGIVVVGGVLVLDGRPPGATLAWCVVAYGLGRFAFEFVRGDPERPYLWGFSEAQWTSVVLVLAVVWTEASGVLPFQAWHPGAAAGLVAGMIFVAAGRCLRGTFRHQLLGPRHVGEVARIVRSLPDPAYRSKVLVDLTPRPDVWSTSLGVRISASRTGATTGTRYHYAFSWPGRVLASGDARKLALIVRRLKHPSAPYDIIEGEAGVFHLLVRTGAGPEPRPAAGGPPRRTAFHRGAMFASNGRKGG
jgi:hypothetical protein